MKKMLRVLAVDLGRAICSWRFAALLLTGLLLLYQPVFYLMQVAEGYWHMELIEAVMSASGLGYYASALALLSGLTYADSFAWEYVGGAFPYMVQRAGRVRYIVSRLITTALASGLLVCACFIVFCGVQTLLLVPGAPRLPEAGEMAVVLREAALLLRYGMTWSLVGLAVSAVVPSPVLAMAAPFCIAQCMWLISAVFDLPMLNVKDTVFLLNGTTLTAPMIFKQELTIAGIAVATFSAGVWKRSYGK